VRYTSYSTAAGTAPPGCAMTNRVARTSSAARITGGPTTIPVRSEASPTTTDTRISTGPASDWRHCEYLGNAAPYLQRVAAQHPEGIRLGAGAHQVTYPGNWKLQVENSIDGYHFSFVHRSFMEVVADRSGSTTSLQNLAGAGDVSVIDLGGGHAVADRGDATQGTLGGIPFNLNVFPNLCVLGLQVRHVIPKSVARTEVCLYPMLHAGASVEHNASILRAHEDFNGPAGAGTADDMEIAFFRVGDGLEATENDWLVLSRGLHRERPGENGVLIGHPSDEVAQRAFYRRWRQLMGGRT
jgi:hypothetical protein